MRAWDELVELMGRPKPPLACSVVEVADGEIRRNASVWFDGMETWWIDDGSVAELRASERRVLLDDGAGLVRHDDGAYVHGWVRLPLEPSKIAYLDTAAGSVLASSAIEGRACTTADVDGLRENEDVTFRIWVDDETGIALRIERDDGAASIEVRDLRIGRLES
jgi:hypothetical protein